MDVLQPRNASGGASHMVHLVKSCPFIKWASCTTSMEDLKRKNHSRCLTFKIYVRPAPAQWVDWGDLSGQVNYRLSPTWMLAVVMWKGAWREWNVLLGIILHLIFCPAIIFLLCCFVYFTYLHAKKCSSNCKYTVDIAVQLHASERSAAASSFPEKCLCSSW